MIGPPLTARARLTLLYTALFAAGGVVVIALTYGLVANSLKAPAGRPAAPVSDTFSPQCTQAVKAGTLTPELKLRCATAFAQGVKVGAQNQRDTTLGHLLAYSIAALAVVTGLAAVAGWVVAGRILRPVHQLTAAARAASDQNLSQRLALGGRRDDLRELADTFDEMLERLESAFAAQKSFIANASHELRTPLTVMRTTLDVVLAKPAPTTAELTAMGADVRRAVDHAEVLIGALLALSRSQSGLGATEAVDLATVAEDVLDATPTNGIAVSASLAPATVRGDPVLLERLVANLVDNALRYNDPGGTVAVAVAVAGGGSDVTLRVANSGPTVDPGIVDRLFQPFERATQRTGHDGFGLGLALVKSIATTHRGTVVASAPGAGGLDVTVTFPAG